VIPLGASSDGRKLYEIENDGEKLSIHCPMCGWKTFKLGPPPQKLNLDAIVAPLFVLMYFIHFLGLKHSKWIYNRAR